MNMKSLRTLRFVITSIFLMSPLFFAGVLNVHAVGSGTPGPIFDNPLRFNSVRELLEEALKIVGYLGAIAAIFFFIYAGFLYVTAGGDSKKLEKAHATFINTAIGTAILLGTSLIVSVITETVNSIRN